MVRLQVSPNVEMELTKAWDSVVGLLGLSASTVIAVCLLVYITIYRALRPAEVIVTGLKKCTRVIQRFAYHLSN